MKRWWLNRHWRRIDYRARKHAKLCTINAYCFHGKVELMRTASLIITRYRYVISSHGSYNFLISGRNDQPLADSDITDEGYNIIHRTEAEYTDENSIPASSSTTPTLQRRWHSVGWRVDRMGQWWKQNPPQQIPLQATWNGSVCSYSSSRTQTNVSNALCARAYKTDGGQLWENIQKYLSTRWWQQRFCKPSVVFCNQKHQHITALIARQNLLS